MKKNIILRCENVKKKFGEFTVLADIAFSLRAGEKMGIVGPNGIGKSTLLKIIAGIDKDYEGLVHTRGSVKYVPQEIGDDEQCMIVSDFLRRESKENIEVLAKSFFKKLNLSIGIFDKKISDLSGGEKNKVAIIRILILPHDILLLDEPTNNLDFRGLAFLEEMIKKSKKSFLIVSHDRKFLDNSVSKILEIDEFKRETMVYDGDFDKYMNERKVRIEKEWADYNTALSKNTKLESAMKKHISSIGAIEKTLKDKRKMSRKITDKDHLKKTVLQDRAGKIGRQARVLKNRLQKEQEQAPEKPKRRLPIKLDLNVVERSGNKVLALENVEKKIGDIKIGPLDLSAMCGDRILIVGDNGAGKSTLVKMILGKIKIDKGVLEIGV